MLLHKPDKTFKRLKGCWKRAITFGKSGDINKGHPLFIAWENCKYFLDAGDIVFTRPVKRNKRWNHERRKSIYGAFDIVCLDWFACRLDEYAKTNMLSGDETVSSILYEWKQRMPFDPLVIS